MSAGTCPHCGRFDEVVRQLSGREHGCICDRCLPQIILEAKQAREDHARLIRVLLSLASSAADSLVDCTCERHLPALLEKIKKQLRPVPLHKRIVRAVRRFLDRPLRDFFAC